MWGIEQKTATGAEKIRFLGFSDLRRRGKRLLPAEHKRCRIVEIGGLLL
jgi:hypothetical protein